MKSPSPASRITLPTRPLIVLLGLTAAITVGSLAYVYLPHSTVTIRPAVEVREAQQQITLSSAAREPDFKRFILPAKMIEKEVSGQKTLTREAKEVKEDFAKGVVTLKNEQDEEQPLLPKTHLRHEESGVFFLTDKAVTIPPHSEIAVSVTAKEQGASGNVPTGKFLVDKLPASLQEFVYGESSQAFNGGIATDSPIVQEEIDQLKEELHEELQIQALGQLTAEAGGAAIHPDLVTVEVISEQTSGKAGSAAPVLTVSATMKARAFVVGQNDLLSFALLALQSKAASDEEFVSYDPDSFKISITRTSHDRGEALVTASLSGQFAKKVSPSVLENNNLAGLNLDETKEHFKQFPAVGTVDVTYSPFWVTTNPSRRDAIEVVIGTKKEE